MQFHLEERRAWVRTATHTVILDRDPEFARFAKNRSGIVARQIRVWLCEGGGPGAYVGAACMGPKGFRRGDLVRMFRRLSREARTELKLLLQQRAREARAETPV